jgi:hypothetical protein
MPRVLHESFRRQEALNASVRPVMVYICECGLKWTDSLSPTWECKCGRKLEKRNGIIHAAIGQRSAQPARVPRVFLVANGQPARLKVGWLKGGQCGWTLP